MQKVKRQNPPFRSQRNIESQMTTEIPKLVEDVYEYPMNLYPSFNDLKLLEINKRRDPEEEIAPRKLSQSELIEQIRIELESIKNAHDKIDSKESAELQQVVEEAPERISPGSKGDVLSELSATFVHQLALERLEQIVPDIYNRNGLGVEKIHSLLEQYRTKESVKTSNASGAVKAYLTYTPNDPACCAQEYLQYKISNNTYKIGNNLNSDLNLKSFGNCCRISNDIHCIIFFDSVSNVFEMLNYSEFGTELNGLLYGLDTSDESSSIFYEKNDQCTCCPWIGGYPKPGWEGSAILQHGDIFKFGCYQFVFGIVDTN